MAVAITMTTPSMPQMWIPALLGQADDEQQAKWMPPSQSLAIIGTYAQTELGHGTFVRGLETTASYNPASQQFVIHSPTLSSTKWWPGGAMRVSSLRTGVHYTSAAAAADAQFHVEHIKVAQQPCD